MPLVEQRAGSCYVWAISSFLFSSLLAGGAFLAVYITQPETSTASWYPFVGVTLVCLPWFFWFITFFYRILSRALGFRMICWGAMYGNVGGGSVVEGGAGGNAGGGGGQQVEEAQPVAVVDVGEAGDQSDGGKHVRFGQATMAVVDGNESSMRSSNYSRESEIPLNRTTAS
ncbi:hypothetical protein Droror1_Dr00024993 [Drosera rotundifolia]